MGYNENLWMEVTPMKRIFSLALLFMVILGACAKPEPLPVPTEDDEIPTVSEHLPTEDDKIPIVFEYVLTDDKTSITSEHVLTEDDVIQIVSDSLKKDYAEYDVEPPRDGTSYFRNGEINRNDYYLVHVYALGDFIEEGIRTSGTIGRFYVNKYTGKTFVAHGTNILEPVD